jgi:hypothetical protein
LPKPEVTPPFVEYLIVDCCAETLVGAACAETPINRAAAAAGYVKRIARFPLDVGVRSKLPIFKPVNLERPKFLKCHGFMTIVERPREDSAA